MYWPNDPVQYFPLGDSSHVVESSRILFHGEPVKRITACFLFVLLSLALFRPSSALASDKSSTVQSPMNQTKQYKKYSKEQAKLQKKQMKAQKKETKELVKTHPTNTTTTTVGTGIQTTKP